MDEEYKKDMHSYECSSEKNNAPQQKEAENQIEGSTRSKDIKKTKNKIWKYEVEDSVSIGDKSGTKQEIVETNQKQSNKNLTNR